MFPKIPFSILLILLKSHEIAGSLQTNKEIHDELSPLSVQVKKLQIWEMNKSTSPDDQVECSTSFKKRGKRLLSFKEAYFKHQLCTCNNLLPYMLIRFMTLIIENEF